MKKNKLFALIVTLLTTAILISACSEEKKEKTTEKKGKTKEIFVSDTSYRVGDNYIFEVTDSSVAIYDDISLYLNQYINWSLKNRQEKIVWKDKIKNGSSGATDCPLENPTIEWKPIIETLSKKTIPRITILDEAQAICFSVEKSSIIVPQDGNGDVLVILPNGTFVDIPGKYYFYKGDESLMVLDRNTLKCVDTIAGIKEIRTHNDKFALLYLDDKRLMIYDLIKPQILVNKISQEDCNVAIGNPDIKIFESLDQYVSRIQNITGKKVSTITKTNLVKVSFSDNGKKFTTLLNSETMALCSNKIYEDIIPFDNDLVGIVSPENLNDKVVTQGETTINGTIGNAKGSLSGETHHGLFSGGHISGSYEYNGDVDLIIKKYEEKFPEKTFKIWKVISTQTGKETGEIYVVDSNGTKTKII